MALYQGDDLINVMTISITPKKEGEELPEIEYVDLAIGKLVKRYTKPDNPFTISIMREESIRLSTLNPVFACIWYWATINGQRKLLKQTCEGKFTLPTNQEVVADGRCKC